MDYPVFFQKVTGYVPFPYQQRLGEEPWPELLDIPTGLGKTAAVVIAWLYKLLNSRPDTPRRLVYCLPMQVLAEQTKENAGRWLMTAEPLFAERGLVAPTSHQLMGGEIEADWIGLPEFPSILIGTQDMLLSRALMRGYGMSRYQWPVHFALLHNEALWVFDEVQLMGAGLQTSAQLEAFRRSFSVAKTSQSLWVSATLNRNWLDTEDMRPYLEGMKRLTLTAAEHADPTVSARQAAGKQLSPARTTLTSENVKQSAKGYVEELADEVLEKHIPGTNTLVVINTAERAQTLLEAIDRRKPVMETMVVHSRFRSQDRKKLNARLGATPDPNGPGRIIVATQAVEAGVDMTSRILFTELAPWSSLVQRFGRCNRYGESNESGGAEIYWIDFETGIKLELPYPVDAIANARAKLEGVASACAAHLPTTDEEAPLHPVLRAKDFRDLFNTDPDLSGFDVDISPYIRGADDLDAQVFWRDLANGADGQPQPQREELCHASLGQAATLLRRLRRQDAKAYRWDSLDGVWKGYQGDVRPGLVLMLDTSAGGYSERFGLMASSGKPVPPVTETATACACEIYGDDWRSRLPRGVELQVHLRETEDAVVSLCRALGDVEHEEAIARAARWHDVGKSHAAFQSTMHDCLIEEARQKTPLLAKSPSKRQHQRKHFRHELASMLAWLEQSGDTENADLVAYLIAAHHGKVRLSLSAMPEEKEPVKPFGPRFASGVWEGEELPGIDIPGRETIPPIRLRLDLMELGEGDMGSSWTTRTQRLLDTFGPFRLAWLESLVRIADWRASEMEQEERPCV